MGLRRLRGPMGGSAPWSIHLEIKTSGAKLSALIRCEFMR